MGSAGAGAGAGGAASGVTGAGVRAPRGPTPGGTGVGMAVRRPAAPGRRHPPRLLGGASCAVGAAACAVTTDGATAAGVGPDDVPAADGVTGRQPDAGALGCAAAGAGALGCAAARPGRHGVPLAGAAAGGCQPPVWSTSGDAGGAGAVCVPGSLAAPGAACSLSGVAGGSGFLLGSSHSKQKRHLTAASWICSPQKGQNFTWGWYHAGSGFRGWLERCEAASRRCPLRVGHRLWAESRLPAETNAAGNAHCTACHRACRQGYPAPRRPP